jgi:DNA (cytosine-5)-methyltransferase 1
MPKIIDLFAGAGGLSLGAARAGFSIAAAIEIDKFAVETHARNFPNSIHIAEDIAELSAKRILALTGLKAGEIAGVVGGPPCQGFSYIGRRQVSDSRNNLFGHFFRLVSEVKPAFFLAENVPGILDEQYDGIRKSAIAKLPRNYVMLPPIEVKASKYGAATIRTRIFFFGYDPKKFSRALSVEDFSPPPHTELTVVEQALSGLPQRIDCRWQTEEQGWRPVELTGAGRFIDRVTNAIPKGLGDPNSVSRYLDSRLVSGCLGTKHTEEVKKRFSSLKYGEMDVISKAVRLNPQGYSPTLRAGTAKDKGSYQAVRPIHFKSPRVITPREAARLQGFPDWFVFHATKWHSFRQIGNSVSPIVSEVLFDAIFKTIAR